jgi:3',5'-cyclic AMP phosphodiesterase CpdA
MSYSVNNMAQAWTILHISDFHISDPVDREGLEPLRNGHFDEYITNLAQEVRKHIEGPLDCLCITGDFVDKGRVENFSHAKKVINFIQKTFGLTAKQVVMCPGNHDLIRGEEKTGKIQEARKDYTAFASHWGKGTTVPGATTERSKLQKLTPTLSVLSIDSTLGAKGKFIPGPGSLLNDESKDSEILWVKENLQAKDQLLIVLSHYPVDLFKEPLVADEEEDFHAKHLWVKGRQLANRIGEWRSKLPARTLWLSGDIHFNNIGSSSLIDFVTAGTFGTRVGKPSQQPRQAKVIRVTSDSEPSHVFTFNYTMPGHNDRGAGGTWKVERAKIPLEPPSIGHGESAAEEDRTHKSAKRRFEGESSKVRPQARPISTVESLVSSPFNVETVNVELETEIINGIASNELYTLGRFETNDTTTSLSWVCIGPLLNVAGILPVTIRSMYQWLKGKLSSNGSESGFKQIVFLGVDCWGAVLASQLSVLSGAPNFCVASRGSGEDYTPHEQISERVIQKIRECSTIIIVHDVVGTGQSLHQVYDQVAKKLSRKDLTKKSWYALSVICDNSSNRSSCDFLTAHGTACGSLRMPVLAKSQLPGYKILKPQLSFRHIG